MSKGNRRPDLAERNRAQHTGPHLYEDASWMRDAYEVRRLSPRQIAKEAGCAHRTVVRWMEIHGIPTRDLRTALSLLDHKGEKSRSWKGGRPSCAGCGKQIGLAVHALRPVPGHFWRAE